MGFLDVLTIVFVILKLVGVINWSWWMVLLPTLLVWGVLGLMVVIPLTIGVIGVGIQAIASLFTRK